MDNEVNAFTEGVAEGGLTNTTQIKIAVEYIIDKLKDPITADIAVEALTLNSLANYFDVTEAVAELLEKENIGCDGEGYLFLTPKGKDALEELRNELPPTVRERALADAAEAQIRQRNEGCNKAVIVKSGDGYNVICTVLHNGEPVMSLTLYTADFAQAETVKTKFTDDPAKVYSTVISMLYT